MGGIVISFLSVAINYGYESYIESPIERDVSGNSNNGFGCSNFGGLELTCLNPNTYFSLLNYSPILLDVI